MKRRTLLLGFAAALFAPGLVMAAPLAEIHHWRGFTKADGLPENACVSITLGAGGNLLVRHAKTNGVTVFDGYTFTTVPAPGTNRGRVYESPGGQFWTVAPEGLLEFRDDEWTLHPVPQIAAHFHAGRTNEIRLQPVRQGRVLIFLSDESLQLDAFDPEHAQIEAVAFTNQIKPPRNDAVLPDIFSVRHVFDQQTEPGGAEWFATADGLFRQMRELWEPAERAPSYPAAATLPPALPPGLRAHAEWKTHFTAKNGDLWLGGTNEIAWRHQNVWGIFSSTNRIGPEEIFAFAESLDGRIWCGTPHNVWEFDGKNWLTLRGGFDRLNSLLGARDGTLWVGTTEGVHRYSQGEWITNGKDDGLPSDDIRAIYEDGSGRITVATALGFSAFHPEADTDAPRTYLVGQTESAASFREGAVVMLKFEGRDKWKQTAPERLLFSYRLDEREWSPFQEAQEIAFADLAVGKHYFQVRAMDRNGNADPKPARLEFVVALPWYRETRLVLILVVALVVALFFAGVAVNRHRHLQRSYAEVEKKIAERTQALELASRELLHSQKMNALGTIAAGIAHDFNNILSIIKGSTQIIEDNLDHPEKIRTRAARIKTVVEQGAGIVQAMLGFSRSSPESPVPCDLNAVVDETLKLLGDRFLREVEVHFNRATPLPEIPVAKDLIQQILLNFIFNAAEAMERRSPDRAQSNHQQADQAIGVPSAPHLARKQITLTTSRTDTLPSDIFLKPAPGPAYILIAVRDAGGGITPENLPRIFEPFFTTKALSTRRGTGLGLSMVYEFAKKMSAGLSVHSVVPEGSTFMLILPVRDAAFVNEAK